MKLTRSQPIPFERPDGTIIEVPPCTRGQMREILLLDLEPAEDAAARRGQIVAIYLRGARWITDPGGPQAGTLQALQDSLTCEEETDIIHAMTLQHHGLSPADGVAIQQAMREVLKKNLRELPPNASPSTTSKPSNSPG